MSAFAAFRHALHVLLRPGRYQRERDEEMRFHLALETQQQESQGLDAGGARAAARRRFGNPTYAREETRRAAGLAWADPVVQDTHYAWRTLRRAPAFFLVAAATLALGIGGSTAVFSIVDGLVLRGMPYREPSRLVSVFERSDDGDLRVPSYPTFTDWRAQRAVLSDVVEDLAFVRGDGVYLPGADGPERHVAAYVTPGFFHLMGTRPVLGRTFTPDEESPGGARVAVLSWELFLSRYGGDRSVIGKTLDVDGSPTTIIGVMPHAFAFPNFASGSWVAPAMWEPIAGYEATHPQLTLRGLHVDSRTVLRLRPGVDSTRAMAVMATIERRLAAAYPDEQAHWTSVSFRPLGEALYGNLRSALLLIAAAIALVLLLACANVANLFLVRGSVRAREMALRSALGAGRWRLARQLLVEALVLSLAGGAAGLALAAALVSFVRHAAPARLPFLPELHVDGRTALYALGASLVTALLVGIAPALHAGAGELMTRMRGGGAAAGRGRREQHVRHALVSLQFALAISLLVGAGLLLQSFRRLASVPLGFDPTDVIEFAIQPPPHRYDQPAQAAALYARILDALYVLPGTSAAAAAGGALVPTPVQPEGASSDRAPDQASYHPVSTGYLKAMRIPLLAGRWFTDEDMRAPNGFVISEKLARRLWPAGGALGKRITVRRSSQARADFGQPITLPVIGVVGDVREYGPSDDPAPEVYLPYTLEVWPWMHFVLRVPDAARATRAVARRVREVEPGVTYFGEPTVMTSGSAAIDPERRFLTSVLTGFAACALLLAAVGLYSIVAYGVVQRTRELGVRIALGAPRGSVVALVMRQGASYVAAGAAVGLVGAFLSTRLIRGLLFDTTPTDPSTFIAVPIVLGVVALAACYLPARRATRTDPMVAIRVD